MYYRAKEIDTTEVEAVVTWARHSLLLSRAKICIFTAVPTGLEFLVSPKRTYLTADAAFCQQFATFKFND